MPDNNTAPTASESQAPDLFQVGQQIGGLMAPADEEQLPAGPDYSEITEILKSQSGQKSKEEAAAQADQEELKAQEAGQEKEADAKATTEPGEGEKPMSVEDLPEGHPVRAQYEAYQQHFPGFEPQALRQHFEDMHETQENMRLYAATAEHRVLESLGPIAIAAAKAKQVGIDQNMAVQIASKDVNAMSDRDVLFMVEQINNPGIDADRLTRVFNSKFKSTYEKDDSLDEEDNQLRQDQLAIEAQKARKTLQEQQDKLTKLDDSTEVRELQERVDEFNRYTSDIGKGATDASENLESVVFSVGDEQINVPLEDRKEISLIAGKLANHTGDIGQSVMDLIAENENGQINIDKLVAGLYLARNAEKFFNFAVQQGRSLERRDVARGGVADQKPAEQQIKEPPQQLSPQQRLALGRVSV